MFPKALQTCVVGVSALNVLAAWLVPWACRADGVDHPNPVLVETCASPFPAESGGRLRGPVSNYKHEIADVREGRQVMRDVSFTARYGEDGAMLEESLYRDGAIGYQNEYRYDPLSGLLLEIRRSGSLGQEQGKGVFSYLPAQGEVLLLNHGPARQLLTRYRFGYDQMGRVISRVIEAADGKVIETSGFSFSGKGLLISRKMKDQSRVRIECVYDAEGRLVRSASSEVLQGGSEILRDESFAYRPDSVEMRWRVNSLPQQSGSAVLQRRSDGAVVESSDSSGVVVRRVRFNDQGDVVSVEAPGAAPLLPAQLEFRYTRDRQGNWITRLTLCRTDRGAAAGAELCEAEYRTIAYHDRRPSTPQVGARAVVSAKGHLLPNGVFLLGRPLSLPLAPIP
jgi:hypothetical protein